MLIFATFFGLLFLCAETDVTFDIVQMLTRQNAKIGTGSRIFLYSSPPPLGNRARVYTTVITTLICDNLKSLSVVYRLGIL